MKQFRVLVVFLPLLTLGCGEDQAMTVEEINKAINEGISRAELEVYFESNGVTYSILEGDELSLESDLPVEPSQLSARYLAMIPNVSRWRLFYRESIVIKVDFGADDKAIHVKVYKSRTGI